MTITRLKLIKLKSSFAALDYLTIENVILHTIDYVDLQNLWQTKFI